MYINDGTIDFNLLYDTSLIRSYYYYYKVYTPHCLLRIIGIISFIQATFAQRCHANNNNEVSQRKVNRISTTLTDMKITLFYEIKNFYLLSKFLSIGGFQYRKQLKFD